jgi:hypothetical protein
VSENSCSRDFSAARQESTRHGRFRLAYLLALCVMSAILGTPAAEAQFPPPPRTNGEIYSILANKKLCLQPASVPDGTSPQGAKIILEPCNGSLVQQWQYVSVSGGNPDHYMNQFSGLCMDAQGRAANQTPVVQWTCNSITNEQWAYLSTDNTNVHGPVVESGIGGTNNFCLDIPGEQATAGTAVQIYVCNLTNAQRWLTP